jgi:GNAT superfamily N-acetyltransferase
MIIRQARPGDAAGITRVHVQSWQTTYRGIIPDDYLDSIPAEQWQARWLRDLSEPGTNEFTYVAENELTGEIAAFVWGGPERHHDPLYSGELYAIYILDAYQRQGLGRRLIQALVRSLLDVGISSLLLWVIDANPGRYFYEALGGKRVKSGTFEVRGVTIGESAYGWTDTRALLQDTSL